MTVPGAARFGDWELRAELHRGPVDPAGPGLATLDASAIGGEVEIRAWQAGDRMRPLGLGGTKSLQDLFTDSGVPRSVRSRIPVVTAGGRVAWVAGVAVSDEFRLARGIGRGGRDHRARRRPAALKYTRPRWATHLRAAGAAGSARP